jgi:hypothetical protein
VKYLVVAVVLVACGKPEIKDTPENKECAVLFKHLAQVEGTTGGSADAVAAQVPFEDYEGCTKSEPEIRACMTAATDLASVKKCLPSEEVLACMGLAKDKARMDLRAKCYAGDAKAADSLKSSATP